MPKNKGKGGKNCRRGKNDHKAEKRELIFKEDGQEYAQVTRMLGSCRLEAMCFDGVKRLCHIRGKLHKKAWISQGDIILIGLRDYQDTKADIILKYTDSEARDLKEYGEFPESFNLNETVSFVDEGLDDEVEFGYENVEEVLDNKLVVVGLQPDKISATADVNKIIKKLGVDTSKEHIKVRVIPTKAASDPVEISFTSEEARNLVLGKQRTRIVNSEETGLSGEKRNIYINEKLSKDAWLTFNKTRDLRTFGYKSIWHKDNQVFCKKSKDTEIIKVTSNNQIETLQWDNKV